MRTEFRLLGSLEVVEDDRPLLLGGPQERALLALLLLRRNQVVSRERIIDELWDGSPPPSAANVVQKHVSRLRKVLVDRVVTKNSGYLLRVEPGEADADRFAVLTREAGTASAAGRVERALALLDEALGLWRDEPLSDLVLAGGAARDAEALEEQRAAALEERIELQLERGRDGELVAELRELVSRYPLRERLRRQLMLALYRSGRQAEALAAYRDARHELVEAHGLEPSAMLRELEHGILVHDDSLAAVVVASTGSPATPPADPPDERRTVGFVVLELGGRDAHELDVEDAEELVGPWIERLAAEVSRFGGTVERRLGDTLYAVFGAQVSARGRRGAGGARRARMPGAARARRDSRSVPASRSAMPSCVVTAGSWKFTAASPRPPPASRWARRRTRSSRRIVSGAPRLTPLSSGPPAALRRATLRWCGRWSRRRGKPGPSGCEAGAPDSSAARGSLRR